MSEERYFATKTEDAFELERLGYMLERGFTDPSFAFIGVTLFGAWGRRPCF